VKFAFIEAEKAAFPIAFMCRQLGVSRAGYYASRTRPPAPRRVADLVLVGLVRTEFARHPRGCGSRPIVHALRQGGQPVGRKRVVRLMRLMGLRHRLKRRFVRTTDSKHNERVARNVLRRAFHAGPANQSWAADITYIQTRRGWAYLAAILDVGSRKVVGWKVSDKADQELALAALREALQTRGGPSGVVHHSDRGIQYASGDYRALLAAHGFVCSMSRKGNCWDNAVVESFFSTLKRELPHDRIYEDWRDVERAVFAYVEAYYNSKRRHSALGYLSPTEYERMHAG
jgi:putative transposase